jgi:hypothetical protein
LEEKTWVKTQVFFCLILNMWIANNINRFRIRNLTQPNSYSILNIQSASHFCQKLQKKLNFQKTAPCWFDQQALATCRKLLTTINRLLQVARSFWQQSTSSCKLQEAFDNNQRALASCMKLLTTINRLLQVAWSFCHTTTAPWEL